MVGPKDGHELRAAVPVDHVHMFASLLENFQGVAYQAVFQPAFTLRFVSGDCEALCGHPIEELEKMPAERILGFVHPDDFEDRWSAVLVAAEQRAPYELNYRIAHRDGSTRWLCERGRCWSAPGSDDVVIDGFISDVTEKVLAAEGVERAAAGFRALVEPSSEPMVLSSRGRILFGNQAAADVLGLPVDEMPGLPVHGLITTELLPSVPPSAVIRPEDDHGLALHRIAPAPSGSAAPDGDGVSVSNVVVHDRSAARDAALRRDHAAVLASIAANRPLTETLELLATLVEARVTGTKCSMLILAGSTLDLAAAPSLPPALCEAMYGLPIGPRSGSCGAAAFHRQPVIVADIATDMRWDLYRHLVLPHGLAACWSVPIMADGEVLGTFALYRSTPGEPSPSDRETLAVFVDLATVAIEHANAKTRMAYEASHDLLTGLPNRERAVERLQQLLDQAEVNGTAVAIAFADLDDFKLVNDRLGRRRGDGVLCEVANRLGGAVREGDLLARFSGDEFVIVCPGIRPDSDLDSLPRRIERALADAVEVEGNKVFMRASVGVAVSHGGDDAEQLLADASAAMYQAKDAGRGGSQHFDESLRQVAHRRGRLENELRSAIDRDEIVVAYQPIVEMLSGRIVGAEALARWTTADGPIGPDEFIPVAERTGLILPLGRQILTAAAHEAAGWARDFDRPRYVSVNVSARQLADPTIVGTVAAVLDETGLPPGLLCLELTETAVMDDPNGAAKVLRALKELGLKLAVDDFGTGYSSLTHLRRFPVDYLKVDRSFVNNVTQGGDDTTIVAAVAGLASNLGLDVVAEGVEEVEQTGELARLGCTYGQGYLWSKPKPATEFRELLEAD